MPSANLCKLFAAVIETMHILGPALQADIASKSEIDAVVVSKAIAWLRNRKWLGSSGKRGTHSKYWLTGNPETILDALHPRARAVDREKTSAPWSGRALIECYARPASIDAPLTDQED